MTKIDLNVKTAVKACCVLISFFVTTVSLLVIQGKAPAMTSEYHENIIYFQNIPQVEIDEQDDWLALEVARVHKLRERLAKIEDNEHELSDWARKTGKDKTMDRVKMVYGGRIKKVGKQFGIAEKIIRAVITVESDGDLSGCSYAGAKGLMQLMPLTAKEVSVRNVFHPGENIWGGARYLKEMLDQFGDLSWALVAYNRGPGNARKLMAEGYNPALDNYVLKIGYLIKYC